MSLSRCLTFAQGLLMKAEVRNPENPKLLWLRRLVLLLLIGGGVVCTCLAAFTDWQPPLVWLVQLQSLADHYIKEQPLLSATAFVICCALVLSCGFPGGGLLAALGGFLFGIAGGLLLTLCSLAISAALVWRLVVWGGYRPEANNKLAWFVKQTSRHPLTFPLLVRAVPIFPFFWLNLAFSLAGQPFVYYIASACLGALPGVFALVVLGSSTQQWLASEQLSLLLLITRPAFICAWLALVGLAAAGYCYKRSRFSVTS